jgi:hypothetical protein
MSPLVCKMSGLPIKVGEGFGFTNLTYLIKGEFGSKRRSPSLQHRSLVFNRNCRRKAKREVKNVNEHKSTLGCLT